MKSSAYPEAPLISLEKKVQCARIEEIDKSILLPVFSCRHQKVTIYNEYDSIIRHYHVREISLMNLKNRIIKGQLSKHSLSNIDKALDSWFESIRYYNDQPRFQYYRKQHKIVMITLTLSGKQVESDQFYKRELFSRFLDALKYHYHVEHYFIRYESQANGNIHAHLIIDRYVNKEKVESIYNQIQKKLGLLDRYYEIHKHYNAPSVKITGGDDTDKLMDYVMKYVTKKSKYRPIQGRLYGMSDKLKTIDVYKGLQTNEVYEALLKMIDENKCKVYSTEHFTVIDLKEENYMKYFPQSVKDDIRKYYIQNYNYLYMGGIQPYALREQLARKKYTGGHRFTSQKLDDSLMKSNKLHEKLQLDFKFPQS